ncbi:MAG: DUF5060 domain-containing protein [Bacteroidetes bacterium]|nr:DUF5060 domain-containing protein [Bacteroidota bacterium]
MNSPLKIIFFALLLPIYVFSQEHYETKILHGAPNGTIAKYETIEIGIRIPEQERLFKLFLDDHSLGANPYSQHFLRLQFICHEKTYAVSAFYMQDAKADEKQNKYVTTETEWPWRVRFAVPDTGNWQCNFLIGETLEMSVPKSCGITFNCVAGNNHGYLNVAADQRHFQFTDGTYFFPLGQNIAWADEPILHGYAGPFPAYNCGYYDVYHYMNNLADNGGNYVRCFMAPWSTGIEWKDLGVYVQERACALDSMVRIAEARGLHIQLSIEINSGFGNNIPKEEWNPYRKAFGKEGGTVADILNDTSALKAIDNYFRYVYARWAFSPAISSIEIVSEQNYWDGFSDHEIYFRNYITHINNLLRNELGGHVHMLSTSCGEKKYASVFNNPAISFIDIHHYSNKFLSNENRFEIIHERAYQKINKPFLFGETGMINGPKNNSDADDFEHCNDINYHNTFWATLFMGDAGCGIYWWQWKSDSNRSANFPALRFFMDSIAGKMLFENESKMWSGNGIETFFEISKNADGAIGWIHNQSYWWGNIMTDCRDRFGKEKFLPKDNDKAEKPENREGETFQINGLRSNQLYYVAYYDTRIPGKEIGHITSKTNYWGKLRLKYPSNHPDCAFRILAYSGDSW